MTEGQQTFAHELVHETLDRLYSMRWCQAEGCRRYSKAALLWTAPGRYHRVVVRLVEVCPAHLELERARGWGELTAVYGSRAA